MVTMFGKGNGWHKRALPQRQLVPLDRFVDEHTFATKRGGYGTCFSLNGIDSENLPDAELHTLTERTVSVKNTLPAGAHLYEYLIKRRGYDLSVISGQKAQSELGRTVARSRADFLANTANLGSIDLRWCVYVEPVKGKTPGERETNRSKALRQVQKAQIHLPDGMASVTKTDRMGAHATAELFSYILNLDRSKTRQRLASSYSVDQQIVGSGIHWHEDYLKIGRQYVQMFSLIERPKGTRPNLWKRLLSIDCNMVLRSRWMRKDTDSVRKEIHSQEGFMTFFRENLLVSTVHALGKKEMPRTAATVAGEKGIDGLGAILHEIEDQGRHYGQWSLIGFVHSEDLGDLRESMSQITQVFNESEARILEETEGAMSAYYAMFPGNQSWDVRNCWMQDQHAGRLSFVYSPNTGNCYSQVMRDEALAVFETRDVTPYFFDPYFAGARGLLITGQTGFGKTFFVNHLIASELKYDPFLYVFDIGRSYESLVTMAGGTITTVGLSGPRVNPFSLAPTEKNIGFLFGFIRLLLERGGVVVRPEEESILKDKIEAMYLMDPRVRRLKNLVLPRHMQIGLRKWTEGGVYGNLFDNLEDQLAISRMQCFEFGALGENNADLMECVLYWIVNRIKATIEDPANLKYPKHLVFDETWKSMRNQQILDLLLDGLKTGRKNRAGVTLATQSTLDLREHAYLIKNSCANYILLGESIIPRQLYREFFELNERELDNIASLIPRRESFLKTPNGSKILRLRVDPLSYALFTTDPNEREKRAELIAAHGFEEGIRQLAASVAG